MSFQNQNNSLVSKALEKSHIAFAALFFFYAVWLLVWGQGGTQAAFVNDLAQVIAFGVAGAALWSALKGGLRKRLASSWGKVAAAITSFWVGQCLWFYYRNVLGIEPFPSLVDVFYLAFYPLMFWALSSFPAVKQSKADRVKFMLDAATVMVAGTMVVWHFLIRPILEKDTDPIKTWLNVAFIVGDFVVLTGVIIVLLRRPTQGSRKPLFIMIAGLLNLLAADITFAYITLKDIESSGPLVLLWVSAPIFFIAAVNSQKTSAVFSTANTETKPAEAHQFSWLPYLGIVCGYGVLLFAAFGTWNSSGRELVVGAIFLTSLVVFRQFTAVKENVKLHTEKAARESEERFQALIQNSSDIVLINDKEGIVIYQSPSVTRVLGYEAGELVGKNSLEFIPQSDLVLIRRAYAELRRFPEGEVIHEGRFRHKDGSWRMLEGVARFFEDKQIQTSGIIINARNITERKSLEEKVRYQAYHDPLTGLGNRFSFREYVGRAIEEAKYSLCQVFVLFIDLDNFKNINDSLGHEAGDQIIGEVARRLKKCVKGTDFVARLGGDEFAILITAPVVPNLAVMVAERILAEIAKPFQVNSWEMSLGVSIGIAASDGDTISGEQLLRNADLAMYKAKEDGKNRFVLFESQMHEEMMAKVELESELRQALEKDELTLCYQPIISLTTGELSGVEALARWDHSVKGNIPPLTFITLAEQSGQIISLGRWVLRRACVDIKRICEDNAAQFTVTVNISSRQVVDPNFLSDVSQILLQTGFDPANLVLEITESVMMEDTSLILKTMRGLKEMGVRIAIDDFGTGYSSLSYLPEFPIDILKIDRSFVDGLEHSVKKNAVARTIVGLSDSLNLRTVAEGIENQEQMEMLKDLGCQAGQGYYIERPVTTTRLAELIQTGRFCSKKEFLDSTLNQDIQIFNSVN
jgi:diguanylate cyclase (GGDEF)-like protein/PAS domain S-box-containing protein